MIPLRCKSRENLTLQARERLLMNILTRHAMTHFVVLSPPLFAPSCVRAFVEKPQFVFGEDALKIAPHEPYDIVRPFRHGSFVRSMFFCLLIDFLAAFIACQNGINVHICLDAFVYTCHLNIQYGIGVVTSRAAEENNTFPASF